MVRGSADVKVRISFGYSGQDYPSSGDGELCINSNVNASIVLMLSFLFLDAAEQSGQGGAVCEDRRPSLG